MASSKSPAAQAQQKVDQMEKERTAPSGVQSPPVEDDDKHAQLPATQQGGAVATADDSGFADFAGAGFKGLNKDDLAIPFLVILQSGSPQCKRSDGQYIEGAAEGMLYNSVTKQVYDPVKEKILAIPCAYDRNFVEWKLRENGGGFVTQHSVAEGTMLQTKATRDDKNRDILESGNQLNDTRTWYVMLYSEEDGIIGPALISMTSTQIKKSKQWLMQQNLLKLQGPAGKYTPPMFASKWRITTVPESNDKGSWMGWAFTHEGYLPGPKDKAFVEAQQFAESVTSGKVRADYAKAAEAGAAPGQPGGADDDIPF